LEDPERMAEELRDIEEKEGGEGRERGRREQMGDGGESDSRFVP